MHNVRSWNPSRLLLLLFLLLPLRRSFPRRTQPVFELLPARPVQLVAQLAEIIHLAPAIAAPLAAGHVDDEIAVSLFVVDPRILAIVATSAFWEAVDLSLLDEGGVASDPGLMGV